MRHALGAVGAALLLVVAGCTEMATGGGDMERTAPETTTPVDTNPGDAGNHHAIHGLPGRR